jgi:hypothetical protein
MCFSGPAEALFVEREREREREIAPYEERDRQTARWGKSRQTHRKGPGSSRRRAGPRSSPRPWGRCTAAWRHAGPVRHQQKTNSKNATKRKRLAQCAFTGMRMFEVSRSAPRRGAYIYIHVYTYILYIYIYMVLLQRPGQQPSPNGSCKAPAFLGL